MLLEICKVYLQGTLLMAIVTMFSNRNVATFLNGKIIKRATAENGDEIVDAVVEYVVDFVEEFRKISFEAEEGGELL